MKSKLAAVAWLIVSVICLVSDFQDERSGVTRFHLWKYGPWQNVVRAESPGYFRFAMTVQWLVALILFGYALLLLLSRFSEE